ncbi:Tigger transposable element-derived protein 4-like [Oopsacas minuta]|uniref:Tigger transposable element-derived protein 4-like n=1 Tax=Oopsacas minuta TaxID=111878 RepID=A0AAV7JQR3_9METZ|nr:Tigger transposable element-derived protein 4-like [Oopsacas minuta]
MNLKAFYRKSVMAYVLDLLADGNLTGEKMSKAIDIKQAIVWIALAWRQVKSQTIVNCFAKAFGTLSLASTEITSEVNSNIEDCELPLPPEVFDDDYSSYINVDSDEPTMGELTIDDAIEMVSVNNKGDDNDLEIIGRDTEDESDIPVPSTSGMKNMIEKMRTFISYHNLDFQGAILSKIEDGALIAETELKKQTTLNMFYTK